jgi:hypothetical protein
MDVAAWLRGLGSNNTSQRSATITSMLTSCRDPILHVSCAPEPDAERIIGDGLNAFNDAKEDMRIGCPCMFSSAIQTVERSSAGLLAERRSG